MFMPFRQTVIVTTAVLGLGGFAAMAASPTDVPVVRPTVAAEPATPKPAPTADRAVPGPTMTETIDKRIADLHTKLQITRGQEVQWAQFAQVMRDNARGTDQTFQQRVQGMGTMSAVDNMKSYAQVVMTHAQDVQKLVPTFQTLYATMSESQKRIADQVFRNDAHPGEPVKRG